MEQTQTNFDRLKLPFNFDVPNLQKEVSAMQSGDFIYYDVRPLRAPAHEVDSSRPFPPPAEDYADGSWTDWLNTPLLEAAPYLKSVVAFFQQHTRVTLVRLLRLAPGATVKEHTDPTLGLEVPKSVIRLTIPIFTNDQVAFYLNDSPVPMKMGECWYLRLTDPHRIVNSSDRERINLTIDMAPNEWVRRTISEAA